MGDPSIANSSSKYSSVCCSYIRLNSASDCFARSCRSVVFCGACFRFRLWLLRAGRDFIDSWDAWDDCEMCDFAECIVALESLLLNDVADKAGEGGRTEYGGGYSVSQMSA